jgi:hypothetical protein
MYQHYKNSRERLSWAGDVRGDSVAKTSSVRVNSTLKAEKNMNLKFKSNDFQASNLRTKCISIRRILKQLYQAPFPPTPAKTESHYIAKAHIKLPFLLLLSPTC